MLKVPERSRTLCCKFILQVQRHTCVSKFIQTILILKNCSKVCTFLFMPCSQEFADYSRFYLCLGFTLCSPFFSHLTSSPILDTSCSMERTIFYYIQEKTFFKSVPSFILFQMLTCQSTGHVSICLSTIIAVDKELNLFGLPGLHQ